MTNAKINHTLVKDISFSLLGEGISVKVRADGYSMYPAIPPGSIIFIEPMKEGSLVCPGEIVAWKRETGLVVHRLVRIERKDNKITFITRGDSCSREDQPVSTIAGRVVRVEDDKGNRLNPDLPSLKPNYFLNRWRVFMILAVKRLFSQN